MTTHLATVLALATVVVNCPGAPDYPGLQPGRMIIASDGTAIAISNQALSATWTLGKQGFKPLAVRDEQTRDLLTFTGEVFQVTLADGTRYTASALVPEARPTVSKVAPDSRSSRLVGRIAGHKVVVPLRSPDQRLRVTWRAIAHDDGNYVRQEIDLTAGRDALGVKEIIWFDDAIPNARTMGRVDGSPMVAGTLFFGYEDPMALNTIAAPEREIGTWSPEDLALGPPRHKSWPLDPTLLQSGANDFVFQYQRGPHRLDLWRVAILEDGREVARDEHYGRAGSEHVDNVYELALPQAKPTAKYELVADLGTDPRLELPPGARVESFGRVLLKSRGGAVRCRLERNATLKPGETLTQSFVIGVAPPNQMRRGFLHYLERERAHPYRPFLHYNSWYDIAWSPFALNETNCLEAIRTFGERFIKPHGVIVDAMVFDDGWDDPKSLWQFHRGFPNGFAPLAGLCRQYNTRLGVWLSPFGGYGEPKNQRLKFGREQGYEINATGFSLAGPKYYAAFKQACVEMIRKYGVNHVKFDGIASGMYASGGADYILDTEAMRRLMLELRQEDPNLYINLTTGSWPSPFWLRYADSLWRQGGDMGHAGKGTKQQQWLTYRDQETYRNIVRKGPLYPLNALMTQGVAYSRHGMAGDPTFHSAGLKDDVRAFFGSGTGLQELYIQPGRLATGDWKMLAEAAKWSRANADVLVDTHWIGGDPSKLEVYGYASWSPRKGIVMLRNPDDQLLEFVLDMSTAFELPAGTETKYRLKSPWAEDATETALQAEGGKPLRFRLKPFEVIILEATSAQ